MDERRSGFNIVIWHPNAQTGCWMNLSQHWDTDSGVIAYYTDGKLVRKAEMDDSGRLLPADKEIVGRKVLPFESFGANG